MMEDSLLLLLLLGCEDGFVSIRTCCSTISSSSLLLLLLRRDQHSNAEAIDLESENECVCEGFGKNVWRRRRRRWWWLVMETVVVSDF